jgi:hypothetical protein
METSAYKEEGEREKEKKMEDGDDEGYLSTQTRDY